jgi:hypothetical protein
MAVAKVRFVGQAQAVYFSLMHASMTSATTRSVEMEIKYKAQELMERTMVNLKIIDALHKVGEGTGELDPFEVTQLVNSFLGALAYPWERLKLRHHGDEPWSLGYEEMMDRYGFPQLRPSQATDTPPKNFRDMVRQLRNGMSHGNIEFYSDLRRDIAHVEVWNCEGGKRTWGTRMSISEMRQFLDGFVKFASDSLVERTGNEEYRCRERDSNPHGVTPAAF